MRQNKTFLELILILSLLSIGGCGGGNLPGSNQKISNGFEVSAPKARIQIKSDYQALPEGAEAYLPDHDGGPFFVTLPGRKQQSVSTKQVLKNVVVPILSAIGFDPGVKAFSLPPSKGIKMPAANFKGLVEDLMLVRKNFKQPFLPKTQKMLNTFLGEKEDDIELRQALETSEGMNFKQLVADVERKEIQYPFQQVVENVPIEHSLILATRWEGEGITSVRGVVYNQYNIINQNKLDSRAAVKSAIKSLAKVKGVDKVISKTVKNGPHLVLLPYGSDSGGRTQLRFTYRMLLETVFKNEEGPFILWLDAETGGILKLLPLYDHVKAEGMGYIRDPGTGTFKTTFEVDPASARRYTLKKQGLSNRIDYGADGNPSNDVRIRKNTNGSSSILANFDQPPINDATESICSSGSNKEFEQVNLLASLSFYTKHIVNLGIFQPFPRLDGVSTDPPEPFNPEIRLTGECNAHSSMWFTACSGYFDPSCPNAPNASINMAQDKTVIAHEMGHNITARLTDARPSDWCGPGTCVIPRGWLIQAHDLADAWADYFEFTNCTAGWVNKNIGGVDNSLNCANHHERGGFPRLHEVSTPFDPASPEDHFPEKPIPILIGASGGSYANGQTGAAALWQVRLGMLSKGPIGAIQFGRRLTHALRKTGFRGQSDAANHAGLYEIFWDLELEMVDQWANSSSTAGPTLFFQGGSHSTNKVTAGFARTGLFLIPLECIDGDPSTGKAGHCPIRKGGENGADAVIDIQDNDPLDDPSYGGVIHPEEDYLEIGGAAPTFQVWTGPRYRLDRVNKVATFNNPAPCNKKFRVEVSTDKNFVSGVTVRSPWIYVDTDPTTPSSPECYGTWTPTAPEWNTLESNSPSTLIYYRAITRGSSIRNRRVSTKPGRLWNVPPPFAVLTLDGRSGF